MKKNSHSFFSIKNIDYSSDAYYLIYHKEWTLLSKKTPQNRGYGVYLKQTNCDRKNMSLFETENFIKIADILFFTALKYAQKYHFYKKTGWSPTHQERLKDARSLSYNSWKCRIHLDTRIQIQKGTKIKPQRYFQRQSRTYYCRNEPHYTHQHTINSTKQ